MSDSELSTLPDPPGDAAIEKCLRRIVREALGRNEEITINLARTRAETQLGLEAGLLRNTDEWKQRSKSIISAAVEDPSSPEKPSKTASKSKPNKLQRATGTKRKSEGEQSGSKRRKKATVVESSDDEEEILPAVTDDEAPANTSASEEQSATATEFDADRDQSHPSQEREDSAPHQANGGHGDVDESDLSSVIDDPPPKKRQNKTASSGTSKPKHKSKSTVTEAKPSGKAKSPDEEEIKRLQGWLIKCGVRKLWHRELAPFGTSKEKTRHLKGMLSEVGMTGRYSVEKARQIKDRRELAAELEAAQEFNDKWGHSGSEGEGANQSGARPRRAAPKGLVDFGDSGDESD